MLRRIRAALPDATVLVVDDGSPDGTADLAEGLGKELGNIEVMRRHEQVRAGQRLPGRVPVGARARVRRLHRDGRRSLPRARGPARPGGGARRAGASWPSGSRYVPGGVIPNWAWHRRLLSRGGNVYASALLGLGVADSTRGSGPTPRPCSAASTSTRSGPTGYGFQIEMTYQAKRAGASVVEVPIRFVDRVDGESKMSMVIVVEALGLVTWWGLQRLAGERAGPAGRRPRTRARSDDRAPGRILVVDDEPYITDVVTAALRFEGFATEEASTGSEALDKARLGTVRPDRAGRHAARHRRVRGLPPPPRRAHRDPGPVPHGSGCHRRQAGRPGRAATTT